jgi:hypothetical protein
LTPPAADGPAPAQITAVGKLHLPYLPVLAAVLSMAVYGLTVPGSPLQFEVSGAGFAILSGCLAVGGGVMMSIFAPFLGKATPPFPSRNSRGARHSHRVTKKTKRSPAVHPRQLHPRSRRTPPGPTPMTSARPRQTRRLPPGLTPKRMLSGIDEFVAGSGYVYGADAPQSPLRHVTMGLLSAEGVSIGFQPTARLVSWWITLGIQ